MKPFKINFENNKAVSVHPLDRLHFKGIRIECNEGIREIKWIIVLANNEQEAMELADKITEGVFIYFDSVPVPLV